MLGGLDGTGLESIDSAVTESIYGCRFVGAILLGIMTEMKTILNNSAIEKGIGKKKTQQLINMQIYLLINNLKN